MKKSISPGAAVIIIIIVVAIVAAIGWKFTGAKKGETEMPSEDPSIAGEPAAMGTENPPEMGSGEDVPPPDTQAPQ